MAIPKWTTTAGLLGTIDERVEYSYTLQAGDTDGDTLTYSIIAGNLPRGLTLSNGGVISGVPLEVGRRTESQFVVRASDGTNKVDRTFKLIVEGSDAPVWSTASGSLGTFRDGDYVSYQLLATDSDSDISSYKIIDGYLPPNVSLNKKTGLLSGVIFPVQQVDFDSSEIGLSGQAFDTDAFDLSQRSGAIDKNYEFTVRVSDGISYSDRTFSMFVQGLSSIADASTSSITADTTTLTADADEIRPLYFVQPAGSLGSFRHENYAIIHIDVVDPGDYLEYSGDTTITYSISSGSLPPGLALNSSTGEIYGVISYSPNVETVYSFTVSVLKSSAFFLDTTYTRNYSITILGEGYNKISWVTNLKELVL